MSQLKCNLHCNKELHKGAYPRWCCWSDINQSCVFFSDIQQCQHQCNIQSNPRDNSHTMSVWTCAVPSLVLRGKLLSNSAATGIHQQSISSSSIQSNIFRIYIQDTSIRRSFSAGCVYTFYSCISLNNFPLINPYTAMSLYQIISCVVIVTELEMIINDNVVLIAIITYNSNCWSDLVQS